MVLMIQKKKKMMMMTMMMISLHVLFGGPLQRFLVSLLVPMVLHVKVGLTRLMSIC